MTQTTLIKYNALARTLHWVIAIAIIVEVILGLNYEGLKDVFPAMPIHKAIGITVLALSLFRLFWRLTHSAPPLPSNMAKWQVGLAHGLHWLFYFMIIAVPLSGWIMSSASKYPLEWFGLFTIPKWPLDKSNPFVGFAHEAHEVMGQLFIPLVILHVGAALYHHVILKDDVVRRML